MLKKEQIIKNYYENSKPNNKIIKKWGTITFMMLELIELSIQILSIVLDKMSYIGFSDHTLLKVLLMFTFVVSITSAYVFFYKR